MTRGSRIHDEVRLHFGSCAQCRAVNPEEARIRQSEALRRTVPDATLAALCPAGRSIYWAYLRWLAEPDE
jgi:hypothetical protein